MNDFVFLPEVAKALNHHHPVVALESTVISHGLPFPHNLQTALAMEAAIKEQGAMPATIAIIHGKVKIGLTQSELAWLAESRDIIKASRRDIVFALSGQLHAATTVAATMILAEKAGITVFATGGIGGVHRDSDASMDISADLPELAKSSVAVICSGAKAILDIPKTLEYLETLGVPIIGYQTNRLPTFYSAHSQYPLDYYEDDLRNIAKLIQKKWRFGLEGGVLVVNPIPHEDEILHEQIEPMIRQAIKDAQQQAVTGKAITPFLLSRLGELTGAQSLKANIALLISNAKVGAQLAIAMSRATSSEPRDKR